MFKRTGTIALSFAVALASAAPSFSQQTSEGRKLAEQAFTFIAGSERGWIDQGGFTDHGSSVFAAMDSDQDNRLTLAEFLFFDTGMRAVAEEAGRADAHETAMRVVFAFWDRDGDGLISKAEHNRSLLYDFQRADIDDNARLELEEFAQGFTVMVALRAAINPAPAK